MLGTIREIVDNNVILVCCDEKESQFLFNSNTINTKEFDFLYEVYQCVCDAIFQVINGDYSNIENLELFKKQYNSFDITKYPRFEEAKRLITDVLPTCGKLGSIPEFHTFCDKHGIQDISDRYFTDFISRFDPKLYCER